MKQLLSSAVKALMILFIIFIMGLFVPMIITTLLVLSSSLQYDEIIASNSGLTFLFWLFTIIGWFICLHHSLMMS